MAFEPSSFEKDIRCSFCFMDRIHSQTVHEKCLERATREEKEFAEQLSKQLNRQRVS